MIEVFRTNIHECDEAARITALIHRHFPQYRANFDLHDCDHILRVVCATGSVQVFMLMEFLEAYDCHAEILEDEIPAGINVLQLLD